jgi:hypothetical protein
MIGNVTLTGPYSDLTKADPDKNNWGPTVGIAWSPGTSRGLAGKLFGNKKAVIRTGYQIGYESFFNNIASNTAVATPNVIATAVTGTAGANNPGGVAKRSAMLPVAARAPAPNDSQTLVIKNLVNPYYQVVVRRPAGVAGGHGAGCFLCRIQGHPPLCQRGFQPGGAGIAADHTLQYQTGRRPYEPAGQPTGSASGPVGSSYSPPRRGGAGGTLVFTVKYGTPASDIILFSFGTSSHRRFTSATPCFSSADAASISAICREVGGAE